ncbi:MAG: hypothetical protein IKR19_08020 [Acholeplasmatales bacterium]|nr:hypothetical protein [Acholeplasmatales bacterium]
MDVIRFNTENNEFVIELSKEKRYFGYSEFGNYICHIKFMDLLNTVILDVITNETQLMNLMNTLYNDEVLFEGLYFNIEFNQSIYLMIMASDSPLCPSEEDPTLYFQFFQKDPIYGNTSRLYLPISLDFKDTLIFNIYNLLQDIPNFEELKYKEFKEYLNDYGFRQDFLDNR